MAMPIEITMPALSPTMEEGNLAKWLVKEGDKVEPGDVIAEIETDKATMEVEAVDEGTIAKIRVEAGTEGVKVNAVIAVLAEEGEDISIAASAEHKEPAANKSGDVSEITENKSDPSVSANSAIKPMQEQSGNRICATPLARGIAAQKGLDLAV